MSLAADVENIRVRESAALSLAALERFQPRPPRSQSGPAKSRPPPPTLPVRWPLESAPRWNCWLSSGRSEDKPR